MSNLPVLPDVEFAARDSQTVIDNVIGGYEELTGRKLAESDPVRLFLLSICYVIIQERAKVDAAGKSNLLYYAESDFLDHIGALRRTPRIAAEPARTTLKFTLSAPRSTATSIPAGTRATPDNELFFATTHVATIPAGSMSVEVTAACTEPGFSGNGIEEGAISVLVDPIPFVEDVHNITSTSGGRDRESDEAYRERIYDAPASFSVAGPELAYIYWARTASAAITDVVAYSPSPAVAEIRVLVDDGQLPSQEILDAVYESVSPKDRRPIADRVDVLAPDVVSFDLKFTYWIDADKAGDAHEIQARVQEAVDGYLAWQRKLGRDLNPSELGHRLMQAGIKRHLIESPEFVIVEPWEVAMVDDIDITYGGLEIE